MFSRFETYITVAKYAFAAAVGGGIGFGLVKGISRLTGMGGGLLSMVSNKDDNDSSNTSV